MGDAQAYHACCGKRQCYSGTRLGKDREWDGTVVNGCASKERVDPQFFTLPGTMPHSLVSLEELMGGGPRGWSTLPSYLDLSFCLGFVFFRSTVQSKQIRAKGRLDG